MVICRTKVVLPAPLGPSMPRNSPGSTVNEMSRFANVPSLYLLVRFKTSTAGLFIF